MNTLLNSDDAGEIWIVDGIGRRPDAEAFHRETCNFDGAIHFVRRGDEAMRFYRNAEAVKRFARKYAAENVLFRVASHGLRYCGIVQTEAQRLFGHPFFLGPVTFDHHEWDCSRCGHKRKNRPLSRRFLYEAASTCCYCSPRNGLGFQRSRSVYARTQVPQWH